MNPQLYDKIQFTLSTLTNRRITDNYHTFEGYFKAFDKSIFDVRPHELEVLNQFLEKPFVSLFKEDYLKKEIMRPPFVNGNCVVKNEDFLGVHCEFSTALFYYLIYKLKENIESFLDVINSKVFSNNFNGRITKREDSVCYRIFMGEDIKNYLKGNISNFSQIHYLLHEFTSVIIIVEGEVRINTRRLRELLNKQEEVYDFENLTII